MNTTSNFFVWHEYRFNITAAFVQRQRSLDLSSLALRWLIGETSGTTEDLRKLCNVQSMVQAFIVRFISGDSRHVTVLVWRSGVETNGKAELPF